MSKATENDTKRSVYPWIRIIPGCASPPDAHHPQMRITPGCASPPDSTPEIWNFDWLTHWLTHSLTGVGAIASKNYKRKSSVPKMRGMLNVCQAVMCKAILRFFCWDVHAPPDYLLRHLSPKFGPTWRPECWWLGNREHRVSKVQRLQLKAS